MNKGIFGKVFLMSLIVFGAVSGCKTRPEASSNPVMTNVEPGTQEHLMMAALWQQNAGEYRALCYQAYNMAMMKLDYTLSVSRYSKAPCVVLDIDETVLDNSPYTAWQIETGNAYSDSTWMIWTSKAIADTVPGALGFTKFARSKGVEVFYLSNRKTAELMPTLKNLQRYGFPFADEKHMLLKTETSNKEPRREQISETNTIVMLVGDNLNDFNEVFEKQGTTERNQIVDKNQRNWGSNYVIVPNPMYGSWYSALLEYQRGLSPAAEDSIRHARLKKF
jgi:5'-nucleotidase (lipoprotein e(P4) family)